MSWARRFMKQYLGFSNKVYELCEKVQKEDPVLAKKIRDHMDDIIKWYIINRRDMKLDEFIEIINR